MATTTPESPAAPEPHDDDSEPIVATIDETGPIETGYVDPGSADSSAVDRDAAQSAGASSTPAREVAIVEDTRVVEAEEPTAHQEPAASAPNVVYVTVPSAPAKKGNRGLGTLFAILASALYAVVLAVVFAAIWLSVNPGAALTVYFNSAFFIPVAFFTVTLVLLVLVLNRAGWWTYVIGSVIVALVVYFGSAGSLLLLNGGLLETPESASAIFRTILGNPLVIAAALLAREVSLWAGVLIAHRGRKVKVRNAEARAAWEQEHAERLRTQS
ncbi:MAG: hypothetical protein ACOH1T_10925 [Microbacteriaceae bacterium]